MDICFWRPCYFTVIWRPQKKITTDYYIDHKMYIIFLNVSEKLYNIRPQHNRLLKITNLVNQYVNGSTAFPYFFPFSTYLND